MVSPGTSYRLGVNTDPENAIKESLLNRSNRWSIIRACGLTSRIRLGARFLRLGPKSHIFPADSHFADFPHKQSEQKKCEYLHSKSEIQKNVTSDCALGHVFEVLELEVGGLLQRVSRLLERLSGVLKMYVHEVYLF